MSYLTITAMVILMLLFIRTDNDAPFPLGFFATSIFASSRIRDGTMGRINTLTVQLASLGLTPLGFLLLSLLPSEAPFGTLVLLAMLPFPVADGVAELVGSFFGRIEFKVYGFGDINKKTVEGVIACWLTAFGMTWAVIKLGKSDAGPFPMDSFVVSPLAFDAILSTVITVVETVSPRGTDDGFGNFFVCATALALWNWKDGETVFWGNDTATSVLHAKWG